MKPVETVIAPRMTQSRIRKGRAASTTNKPGNGHSKPPAQSLTASERTQLESCENTIKNHFESFAEAGKALRTIRDSRLYREHFLTFEDYCRSKWEMSKTQANRLIASFRVTEVVGSVSGPAPTSESQIRPLTMLKEATQKKVWQQVTAQAKKEGAPITAKLVNAVAHKVSPRSFAGRGVKPGQRREAGNLIRKDEIVDEFNEWAKRNVKLIEGSSGPEVVKMVRVFLKELEA